MGEERADSNRRPASRRVADQIKALIESGVYPVGSPLPSLRALADEHEVALNTAISAVRQLSDEGYLTTTPNRRAYVRDRSLQVDPEHELHTVVTALTELRTEVRKIDGRLAELTETVSRLVAQARKPPES